MKKLKNVDKNTSLLFVLVILIFAVMAVLQPSAFLGLANIQGMCIQFPEFGIMALGMMLAMIAGGIDLSLVGIANFASIVGATIMVKMGGTNGSIVLGIIAAIIIGLLCGTFNGFMIGYLQIPPMLVTLCGLQLYTGLGLAITKGPALTGLPESFSAIANGVIGIVPIATIIFLICALVVAFMLRSTVYGQQVCFMGTNNTASRYSGINNLKITIMTYGTSGILGGIAGVIMASHYNSAKSDYGSSYTLLTLLIVVLGGTNPDGGKGSVLGVSLAVLVLQLVSSAFNIMRINSFLKTFVWGLILLVIIVFTKVTENKKASR
ncbi:MAG: ABC transporter permease [Lachnospiraceae bacterium]|nr:ABC transporter permease [Lachnospiraceae bacterium]MDD7079084.1 ABC transporter permease [Lachnospiraceae bacterium]MDY3730190.1 ABC transporter permease [Candidatus Choladocola sp.]